MISAIYNVGVFIVNFLFCVGMNYARDLMVGLFITVTSWVSALVTVLIMAVLVTLSGCALSWYTHFYVSVALYGAAGLAKILLMHSLAKKFYFAVSVLINLFLLFIGNKENSMPLKWI